jgi:hypothetical protein
MACDAGFHWLKSPTTATDLAWGALQMKFNALKGFW